MRFYVSPTGQASVAAGWLEESPFHVPFGLWCPPSGVFRLYELPNGRCILTILTSLGIFCTRGKEPSRCLPRHSPCLALASRSCPTLIRISSQDSVPFGPQSYHLGQRCNTLPSRHPETRLPPGHISPVLPPGLSPRAQPADLETRSQAPNPNSASGSPFRLNNIATPRLGAQSSNDRWA